MPPLFLCPTSFESVNARVRHWLMVLCSSLWLLLALPVHRRLLRALKIPWCSSLWLLLALPAAAQETMVAFDVPAQPLARALDAFAEQAQMQILYKTETVEGLQSSTVAGRMTPEEALRTMLRGTGLTYQTSAPHTITVIQTFSMDQTPATQPNQDHAQKPIKVPEVVVKDVRERPTWTTPVDGYKADHASTVTRSTMSIDETPVSIGVVTRDLIRDTFARTQSEAFEGVSGVARSGTRQGRAEAFSIRGFAVNDVIGSFNGVKANGLPTDGLFAPDWGIVERYEIVKGPASIVGGAATPGGVINRVTKTPRRENFTASEFQAGSYGFLRGMVDANGMLPSNEHVRGRLVFSVEEGGHFINNTPLRQYSVAPSVEVDLFKGAGKLLAVGTYQHFIGASYPGWPLASDGTMLNVPRTRNFGGGATNGASTQYTGYNGELHYDHQFIHDIKLSVKGKYSNSALSDKILYAYSYGGIPPSGELNVSAGLVRTRFDTYAGELTLRKNFSLLNQQHEVLAGMDHRDMTQYYSLGYVYLPSNASPLLDNVFNPRNGFQAPPDSVLLAAPRTLRQATLKQSGIFAQVIARPFERLTLVAAGRHDWADSSVHDKLSNVRSEQTQSAWTGRFGATLKISASMNLYAGVQQSFAPQPFGLTSDGSLLAPETGINYETGAKFNLFDNRLRITTALFRTHRQNVATRDLSDLRFVVAVGEQRHQGVELDVNGQPVPGLSLNANVAFLDAKITHDNDPGFIDQRPQMAPEYVGRFFATYEIQSGPLHGFGFGGGVHFQDGYEMTLPNRIKTNPYHRVDAVLFYRGNKHFDISLNVRNLLDARYIESPGGINAYNSFGAPVSAFGTVRIYF